MTTNQNTSVALAIKIIDRWFSDGKNLRLKETGSVKLARLVLEDAKVKWNADKKQWVAA